MSWDVHNYQLCPYATLQLLPILFLIASFQSTHKALYPSFSCCPGHDILKCLTLGPERTGHSVFGPSCHTMSPQTVISSQNDPPMAMLIVGLCFLSYSSVLAMLTVSAYPITQNRCCHEYVFHVHPHDCCHVLYYTDIFQCLSPLYLPRLYGFQTLSDFLIISIYCI